MDILRILQTSDHTLDVVLHVIVLIIKITLVFFAAVLVTRIMKRGSAAARHLVWTLSFCIVLLLPIWDLFMPVFPVTVPGMFPSRVESGHTERKKPNRPVETVSPYASSEIGSETSAAISGAEKRTAAPEPVPYGNAGGRSAALDVPDRSSWERTGPRVFVGLWIFGLVMVLCRQIAGRFNLLRYRLRSVEVEDPSWHRDFTELKNRLGVLRSVRLLRSERSTMVMTWGLFQPRILLPSNALEWNEERRRFVLMHEFAHIRRLDALTQMLVQIGLGLYWFHPLAWSAKRAFFKEREHACDDFVLQQGSKPSEYAGLLLDVARSLSPVRLAADAAVSMARRSQLEGRLLAILSSGTRRNALRSRTICLVSIMVLLLFTPLAALQPVRTVSASAVQLTSFPPESISATVIPQHLHPMVEKSSEMMNGELSEAGSGLINDGTGKVREGVDAELEKKDDLEITSRPDGAGSGILKQTQSKKKSEQRARLIESLSETLRDPDPEVRIQAAETLGRFEDEMSIEPLTQALDDQQPRMRLAVVEALGRIESRKAIDGLIRAMRDEEWRIRAEAASALGELEDERALQPLTAALSDAVPAVRLEAVESLGEIANEGSGTALVTALSDEDWEIRREAAYALGKIGGIYAVDGLIGCLQNDVHREVRCTAAESLGEIGDRRAITALLEGTKASYWEIRKAAVESLEEIGDPSVIDGLIACFHDDHVEVRRSAVEAAGEMENVRAVRPLMDMLDDEDWEIRRSSAEALSEIGDPAAASGLIDHLKEPHPEVRESIVEALGELEILPAVEPLIGLIEDPEIRIRIAVIEALGEIGDPKALDILTIRLKDENDEVRKAAAKALGDLEWRQDH